MVVSSTTKALAEDSRVSAGEAEVDLGRPAALPLPSTVPIATYEKRLFSFLNDRTYLELGWRGDKRVRDTGPFIDERYYGTHPAVRVYYSPEVLKWLMAGRTGTIPDGAMIIKEQYDKPATRHAGKSEEALWQGLNAWTVMVKDSGGSFDGWFWSNPQKGQSPDDNHQPPFPYPLSGFGHYCLRCHASTDSPGSIPEYTFSSLRNIRGFRGDPILFRVDDSWRFPKRGEAYVNRPFGAKEDPAEPDSNHPRCVLRPGSSSCVPELNPRFLAQFPTIPQMERRDVRPLPPSTHDWVVRAPRDQIHRQGFVTANQCMSCHSALSGDFGPTMIEYTTDEHDYGKPGRDYSPFGEWQWTPMGLAGRDPIFYAQMETEIALLRKDAQDDPAKAEPLIAELVNTCLRCHGVMGKRQWDLDQEGGNVPFTLDHVLTTASREQLPEETHAKYGALARDGVSCVVCHRMQPRPQPSEDPRSPLQFFLETSITGNFVLGPPGEIYGPYQDTEISPYAMEHAIGFTPKHHPYLSSSRMCGSCHTVSLPMVELPLPSGESVGELGQADPIPAFRKFKHHVEQATYLEWLNSEYENEYHRDNPRGQSCQNCHMSRDLHSPERGISLDKLATRMAIIQDDSYPEAENLASHEKLHIRVREEGFARHNFSGLNLFMLEMFQQYDDLLGVRKQDFMTGIEQIPDAVSNFLLTAREKTASIALRAEWRSDDELEARVVVENKAGHRFPSGVGFRRAFLEFLVIDRSKEGDPAIVWSSGRTNDLGILVDHSGTPLASEFFQDNPRTGRETYQPHHHVITSSTQAQVYETLLWDAKERFTTSFIRGCKTVKDNRLLPRGWRADGNHPELKGEFLKATYPDPVTLRDSRYADGSGSDEVVYRVRLPAGIDRDQIQIKVSLFYQAIPPYFLKALFENAASGPATQRLHYMCANLRLQDTPIEDWKLRLVSAEIPADAITSTLAP